MNIFPAIDIRGGKAVRLLKGDYGRMTVYSTNPKEVAEKFLKQGVKCIHLVDLDGAKDGEVSNLEVIRDIASIKGVFLQLGGGIRREEAVREYLDMGIDRVILGTIAVKNPSFLKAMIKTFGEAIAVGVDARDGRVAINGWEEKTSIDSFQFCKELKDMGVRTIIYTDIARDGTLSGTNLEAYKKLVTIPGLKVIASGGITYEEEIVKLMEIGAYGAIVGKAIYENKLDLSKLITITGGNEDAY